MKRLTESYGKLQTQLVFQYWVKPSEIHELYQLPRNTHASATVSSLRRESSVYRLCTQSTDYAAQSTVSKDCKVYRQSTDYPKSGSDCPRRAQSGNQGKIKYCTGTKISTSLMVQEFNKNKWKDPSFAYHQKIPKYADVFKGVGTLPGGPYHTKLKDSYKPVQHPPKSVPLRMQTAYNAELNRQVKEGIITEVHEHTEWINSIVPIMKEDGSLKLCIDPKHLNKAIKRNQWYARTLDDILP